MSDSLRPHESQHARPPCPPLTPRVHSDSCPLSQWCHPPSHPLSSPSPSAPNPPSIRVFANESTLRMRWPKYWSFSFSISPSNEHQLKLHYIYIKLKLEELLLWQTSSKLVSLYFALKRLKISYKMIYLVAKNKLVNNRYFWLFVYSTFCIFKLCIINAIIYTNL